MAPGRPDSHHGRVQTVQDPGRFAFVAPRLGRARGGVRVAGALVVDHPLIKQAVIVPFDQIAGFAAGADLEQTDPTLVLEHDLRLLRIASSRPGPSPVVVVLRAPVAVGPFTFGADGTFPISKHERRHGTEVSILELDVADGAGLAEALRDAGARPAPLVRLLREVGGEAIGPLREERIEAAIAAHRRAVWGLIGAAVLTTLALVARVLTIVVDDVDWSVGFIVQLALASLLVMVLSAALVLRPRRVEPIGPPDPLVRPPGPGRVVLVVGTTLAAFAGLVVASDDLARPALVGLAAVASGGLGGLVVSQVARLGGPSLPGIVARPAPSRGRRRLVVGSLLVAVVAVVAGIALLVPSDAERLAERATVSVDQLPRGWSERYSEVFDRDPDGHICGADREQLPARTGAYQRGFERGSDDEGIGPLWIDLMVILAPTEESAQAEFAAVDSPGYESCLLERVEQMTEDYVADDSGPARSHRLGRTTPQPGVVVDHTVSEYLSTDGSMHLQHITFVRMQVRRAIVRMPISSFRGAVSDREVEELVGIVRDHVDLVLADDS